MSNELPPFYVGQEVVSLVNRPDVGVSKGAEFKVLGIEKGCCYWKVNVGIALPDSFNSTCCKKCGKIKRSKVWWASQYSLAPKDQFKAITFTKVMETELVSQN
jgi:hypothetical protein